MIEGPKPWHPFVVLIVGGKDGYVGRDGQLVDPGDLERRRRAAGGDLGPACEQCGGMMQRTGSCYPCSSCGNNTGCG